MTTKAREQKLVDIMYQIAMTINERRDFFDGKSNEEIASWVSGQLEQCGFPTVPVGASWGVLK